MRVGSFDGLESVGVMLTPRADGIRDWDTTMFAVKDDPLLEPDEFEIYRGFWNSADAPAAEAAE